MTTNAPCTTLPGASTVADPGIAINPPTRTPTKPTRDTTGRSQFADSSLAATMEPNNNDAAESAEQVPAPEAEAAADAQPGQEDAVAEAPVGIPESRLPTKKDTSLREFLGKMDDYAPIVCCSVHHSPLSPLPLSMDYQNNR